jgi:hypothetical protein
MLIQFSTVKSEASGEGRKINCLRQFAPPAITYPHDWQPIGRSNLTIRTLTPNERTTRFLSAYPIKYETEGAQNLI